MNRSNKRKFAVTLLGALAFGANAQAQDLNKNKITKTDSFSMIKDSKLGDKSSQTIGTVGGANSNKNLERIEKGLSILEKVLIGTGIVVGAGIVANEGMAGITLARGKKPDSIFKGKYSITNLIHSKIKKNDEQPGYGGKDPKKFGSEGKKEIVDQNEIEKHNMQKIDEALDAYALKEKSFEKNAMKQKILQAFEKFVKIDLSKFSGKKFKGVVAYENVEISEGLSKLKEICNNQLKIFSAELSDNRLCVCYENNIGYELDFVESTVKVYCYGIDDDEENGGCVNGLPALDIYNGVIVAD